MCSFLRNKRKEKTASGQESTLVTLVMIFALSVPRTSKFKVDLNQIQFVN